MTDDREIAASIAAASGLHSDIVDRTVIGGGSICAAVMITLADGRRYFVKTHPPAARCPGMFAAEALALERLRATQAIRVPAPVAVSDEFLVLEPFTPRTPDARWQVQIGRELAALHRLTADQAPGFESDNYLGTTPQPNTTAPDWVAFWRDRRLLWQLGRFAAAGNSGDHLLTLGYELADRLDSLIGEPAEPCVLLHGDLWIGNAAADADGAPVIFDPASYYGRREAELGMMQLFGGFDPKCFAAYEEVWPLAPDNARRIAVYRLYHELNHLNLFGRGYYEQCMATLRGVL